MPSPGFWIVDDITGEERFIHYDELEQETIQSFIKPIGGFIFPVNLFCLSHLPDVPFYVKDWLPKRGKSLLYAPPKAGKSFLCLQIARCISSAEDFLNIPTKRGSVLYIQLELGEEILQARLRQTGKDYENVFVGTTFSMKLDMPTGQKLLWTAMEAVEPNVLIIDPWYKAIAGDENESSDTRKITDFLDAVIEGFNCSILIIHHSGKDLARRGRGSSVLEDWVDSYLQMKKVSEKNERLRVKIEPIFLRHAQMPPEPIEAKFGEDYEFHCVRSALTVKEQVEEVLASGEPISPADLFKIDIGSNTSVYNALKELVEEGTIEKIDRGLYQRKEKEIDD